MVPARPEDLAAGPPEDGAVDRERDRRAWAREALEEEVEQAQAEAVGHQAARAKGGWARR